MISASGQGFGGWPSQYVFLLLFLFSQMTEGKQRKLLIVIVINPVVI